MGSPPNQEFFFVAFPGCKPSNRFRPRGGAEDTVVLSSCGVWSVFGVLFRAQGGVPPT